MKDGKLTDDILVLEDKLMEPVEKMSTILISELIRRKEDGKTGKIENISFEHFFTEEEKKKLMNPIQIKEHKTEFPVVNQDFDFF